jgi:hypothetical protein
VIVHRYLAHKEVAVHGNPDAGPGARIAAFAGLRPVLGEDRLTVGPAWFHRMAVAELGRFSVASMVSRRAAQALAELMWSPLGIEVLHMIPARDVSEQDQEAAASVRARPVTDLRPRR